MESTKEITLFIALTVLAILFFIVLVAFVIIWSKRKLLQKENIMQEREKQKQVELIKAIVDTEETLKTKIAHDLHDQIISSMTLAALNLNTRIKHLEEGNRDFEGARVDLEAFAKIADQVREISYDLIPEMFKSYGLIKSIERAVKQINTDSNSRAVFKNDTLFSGVVPFTDRNQLTIFRICLEILNNLRKHANYKNLTVRLEDMSNVFTLVFAHDGIGLSNTDLARLTENSTGIGLKSMQSRAVSLGGSIDYIKDKGASFITLKVPIKNETGD